MNKRFLLVGGACVLAGVVLVLAILASDPQPAAPQGNAPVPPQLGDVRITDEDVNSTVTPSMQSIQTAQNFEYYLDDGKTQTRFYAQQVSPQQDFVSDVIRPGAEIRFSESKLLLITAAAGTFFHPGDEPSRGDFNQDTVVTQYEAPEGVPVDLESEQHVQFRLYLDELTKFDRERGHVYSAGPVRLVGPEVDFTGTGLDLTFNLLEERIEKLVIAQGDELRLARSPQSQAAPEQPQDAQPAQPDAPQSAGNTRDRGQQYIAVLYDQIAITLGQDEAQLAGDRLEVRFAIQPSDEADNPAPIEARHHDPPTYFVNTQLDAAPNPASRAIMQPGEDDIIVHWAGRLELTPTTTSAGQADAALTKPGDARFTLHGQPARLTTANQEQVTAAHVGFNATDQRLFAKSSSDHPLLIQTPELGTLTGTDLSINQAYAQGYILGPGRLTTPEEELDVSFALRLDLAFAPDAEGQLTALESATFLGTNESPVRAKTQSDNPDNQLDLAARSLKLTLTPDAEGVAQPSHLQALGDADHLVTAQQPDAHFQAESLDIDLAPPAPGSIGTDATPKGSGTSVPVPPTAPSGPAPSADFQVTRLRALGHVQVKQNISDPDNLTTLTAHALDADPQAKRLELFGQGPRQHATLTRADAALSGEHLILNEENQAAAALGPGTFTAALDEDDPTARINIAWSESMDFNNARGSARFVGNVSSASTSADDDTSLDGAHELTLKFVPQDFENAQAPADDQADADQPKTLDLRHARAVANPDNLEAKVNFTAQSFDVAKVADGQIAPPLTRLTLISRELVFINQPPNLDNDTTIDDAITIERISIPNRGRMLLEDYRTPQGAGTSAPVSDNAPTQFAGRGLTVFDWSESLTLDAQTDELRLLGDVSMIHQPADSQDQAAAAITQGRSDDRVSLQAKVLTAHLTETGGFGAYVNGDAPQAQIKTVRADGDIRVASGRQNIEADHLDFDQAKGYVELWAEPRRRCILSDGTNTTTAQGYRWILESNIFKALKPGSGVVPLE